MGAIATEVNKNLALARELDPFGDHGEVERMRHHDDGGNDGAVSLVRNEAIDEGLVDLDKVKRELA